MATDQRDLPTARTCLAAEQHRNALLTDMEYRQQRRDLLEFTRVYATTQGERARTGIVVIPVVVHVLWNQAQENISDAQIMSQINVLNADFRRQNADVASVPPAFQSFTADSRIQFQLAVRDPNCATTSGIIRTQTTVNGFFAGNSYSAADNPVKFASSGGADAWPRDKYLNIWICRFQSASLLGYATFPGAPANVDGVVIRYDAFGTTGTLMPTFNLGRTTTHEVGHWLNLFHIWGNNDPPDCADSDEVADTPNQEDFYVGCPTSPQISCSNGPNGAMFMNYMDYTNDACMYMFTAGQAERMNAALVGARSAILGSDALVPPGVIVGPDLWSADLPEDLGNEPDAAAGPMWASDDIWVRRQDDGLTVQDHENPEYRPAGQPTNWIYVRVRNRGCQASATAELKLYWAKASTALGWPAPWDGSVTTPALMGGQIGSQATGSVPGGGFTVLKFPWSPPNPEDYASFGADKVHFCLLARIETQSSAPFGMTFAETSNLYGNVQNNNNIVWKNITVVDEVQDGGRFAAVLVEGLKEFGGATRLDLRALGSKRKGTLLDFARVEIELDKALHKLWTAGGNEGFGIEKVKGNRLLLTKPRATLDNIQLEPGEYHVISVHFAPLEKDDDRNEVYYLDIQQYAERDIVGGVRVAFRTRRKTKDDVRLDVLESWDEMILRERFPDE